MEQSYALKKHGGLTLFEQDVMVAEDRAWWIERLKKDEQKKREAESRAQKMPNAPNIKKPHIPR